jgi:hypothetical protein
MWSKTHPIGTQTVRYLLHLCHEANGLQKTKGKKMATKSVAVKIEKDSRGRIRYTHRGVIITKNVGDATQVSVYGKYTLTKSPKFVIEINGRSSGERSLTDAVNMIDWLFENRADMVVINGEFVNA